MDLRRWPLLATIVAVALAIASTARADGRPRLKIIDRGAQVEIVVSDVRLVADPVMKVNRERIELPLAGRPAEVNDEYPRGLVMRIDVRGDGARTLSVKLRRDHNAVVALARGAFARQEDDGVHLFVPIAAAPAPIGAGVTPAVTVPAPTTPAAPPGAANGATVTIAGAPAATAPAAPAATAPAIVGATAGTTVTLGGAAAGKPVGAAAGTAIVKPSTDPAGPTGASVNSALPPAPTAPITGNHAAPPLTGGAGHAATAPAPKLTGGDGGGPALGRVVIAVVAIALAGVAVVALRRRRGAAPVAAGPQLEILATRSLGGKTRVLWLGAGDRELVVAVAGTNVNLLGQWRRGEADRPVERLADGGAQLRLEPLRDDGEPSFAAGSSPLPRVRGVATSAVSGIMRLRGKVTPITDDVATGDSEADEQWARDILAATGGRR